MKVLKESKKEQKVISQPRRPMRNPVVNGVTVPQSAVINGAIESKSPTKMQDLGEKVSAGSRQQSMRKSRTSGELERDVALSAVHSSAKLTTATPLNPVTPLRWKSTKRIESEKKKLQEEIKAKEAVKEEKKNSKLAKEERKDQSKMATTSKLGFNGIENSHKADTPSSNHVTSQENKGFSSSASTSKSVEVKTVEEKTGDWKHSHPVANGGSNEHAERREEVSPFNEKHGTDQTAGDNSGTDRKPFTGDESAAITIDFLRARLLAERASSKAAKERIHQLAKKVQELEGRLDQEILSRKKAEEAAQEALLKIELLGQGNVLSPRENEPLSLHAKTKTDQQVQELLNQSEEKCQVPADVDDTMPNATADMKPGRTQSTSLEIDDDKEQVVSEVEAIPTSEEGIGGHHGVQSSEKIGLQDVKHDDIPIVPSMLSTNGDTYLSANSELKRPERRFSTEERLQHMWNQMAVEMAALAEDKTTEDRVREGLLNWMRQVPSVVQNILPKPSEETKLVTETRTKNMQLEGGDAPRENLDSDQALNSKEETIERSLDGASYGDGSRAHDKGLKKVASLIERFEANESIQREWEQNNAKQNSTSRRRSNESSLIRNNSNPGTPYSAEPQQGHRHEVSADASPKPLLQVENPIHSSFTPNSSASPLEGTTAESLLITKDNGIVGIHTPGNSTSSGFPDPPIIGQIVRRSGGEGITPIITHGTINPSLEHGEFGLEGFIDASFNTPPTLSPSSGPSVGDNRGDISSSSVDRKQLLKQRNHPRALEGNCKTPESHSERSSGEIGEPLRPQALIGWVSLEEGHTSPVLTSTGDHSSLQSIRGRNQQHERPGPYSQAGNSNAYIRPGHYPLRNDEREIYRGRMESVSRSMEGLGGSWRSLSDAEGDETQLFADIPDATDSEISRRSGSQLSFQANGGSGWSNYCQAENMEGTSQSLAYPGREFLRENIRSRSASVKIESSSRQVNEVLKALQLAKLSIQNSGGRRSSISNASYPTEHRYAEGDKHNLTTDYGFSDGRITKDSPAAVRDWSHPEIPRRYSTGNFRNAGSLSSHLQSSNSAPIGMLMNPRRKYPDDKYLKGRS